MNESQDPNFRNKIVGFAFTGLTYLRLTKNEECRGDKKSNVDDLHALAVFVVVFVFTVVFVFVFICVFVFVFAKVGIILPQMIY